MCRVICPGQSPAAYVYDYVEVTTYDVVCAMYDMLTYDILRDVRCRTYNVVRLHPVSMYRTYDVVPY